jgi:WD40 repeat protein
MLRSWIVAGLLAGSGMGVVAMAGRQLPKTPPPAVQKAVPPLRTLSGLTRGVKALAFSPDDKTLFSAGEKEIRVWDAVTGEPKTSLVGAAKGTVAVAVSPDGKRIVAEGEDGSLLFWDAVTGMQTARQTGNGHAVRMLSFSAAGDTVLGARGSSAVLFDAATGEEKGPILGHATVLSALSWSPDGKRIAVGCAAWPNEHATAVVWEISPVAEVGHGLTFNSNAVRDLNNKVITPAARTRLNDHVKYFRQFKQTELKIVVQACFAADSDTLAVAWGTEAVLHSMQTDQDIRTFSIPPEEADTRTPLRAMALSPDGKLLAVVRANVIQVWKVGTGRLVARLPDHGDDVDCLVFSHDGKMLVSGSADKTIKLWNMAAY